MDTSERIITSSFELFYRNGYHATGVDLLCRKAGVTKKTLYRHYPSKEALIESSLAFRHDRFMTDIHDFVKALPITERPCGYIQFVAQWVGSENFFGCAFINAAAEFPNLEDTPHRHSSAHKKEIINFIKTLCCDAGVSNSEEVSLHIFLIGEGLITSSQVLGYNKSMIDSSITLVRDILANHMTSKTESE